jgi:hypothetical protein
MYRVAQAGCSMEIPPLSKCNEKNQERASMNVINEWVKIKINVIPFVSNYHVTNKKKGIDPPLSL